MALSIFDIQRLKETNYEKGIVEMFIRESDLMKVLPFENIDTMSVQTRRMSSLPAVAWRKRGARFTDGGQPGFEVVTDALYNIGAEINLDDADMKDKGPYIENPVEFNTKGKVTSIIYDFHDKVVNGDHATNEDSFEGVRVRIAACPASQTLYTSSKVDVRPGTVTAATAYTWLNRLEEAKYALDGHGGGNVICLTDADFIRSLKNALRIIGQYVAPPGKPVTDINVRQTSNVPPAGAAFEWDGVKYIDMGVKADQTTKIIPNLTQDSVTCRQAYFVKLGNPYFHIIQYGPMDIQEPRRLDDMVTFRGVISWYVGGRHVHNRFGVHLGGSQVA